ASSAVPRGETDMRPLCWVWLLAAAGLAGPVGVAQAGHLGACRYPAPCITPDQCAPAVVGSCVSYQQVVERCEKVCYRPVYKTCYQPQCSTTYKTVTETHYEAERYAVQRPVVEYFDTVQRYCVQRPVYDTCYQEQRYTVMRPVTRTFQVA